MLILILWKNIDAILVSNILELNNKRTWKKSSSFFSVSLPFPPLGNDLEALQILLCFCRSNLHPRSAARSESTLVSTVSNIYLSQQTRDKPGSCWSLETSRQNYQLATRSLPAERALLREDDSTDWICHSLQHLHQPVRKRRQISTILFQHLPFVSILLAIFFLRC